MQDDVLNRRLFNRGSTAARDRVRKMGGVQEPQGILASYQELMQAARPQRGQGLMPMIMQDARPIQPVRMQEGGDVTTESLIQRIRRPEYANPAVGLMAGAMQPVDIAATPTPRAPVETPDISSMVRANLSGDEAALAAFDNLEGTLTNPESTPEDVQEAVTSAAGVENTADGMRSVVSAITGREQPADATVDELNRAIMGVSLGGAIGGPRSVAERISNALLVGLQAQRETATTREAQESAIRRAAAGGGSTRRSTYTPERLFQQAVQEIMKDPSEYDVYSERPGAEGSPPEPFVDPVKVRAVAEQIAAVQATALGEAAPVEGGAMGPQINYETGQVVVFNGSQWVDAETGEPVQ